MRIMGRNAAAYVACAWARQQLISMLIPESGAQILTASGARLRQAYPAEQVPASRPRRPGVIAMVTNERNGALIAAVQVQEGEEIMLISDQGTWCGRVIEVSLRPQYPGRNPDQARQRRGTGRSGACPEPSGGDDEDLPEGEEAAESLGESAESESEPAAEAEGNEE